MGECVEDLIPGVEDPGAFQVLTNVRGLGIDLADEEPAGLRFFGAGEGGMRHWLL